MPKNCGVRQVLSHETRVYFPTSMWDKPLAVRLFVHVGKLLWRLADTLCCCWTETEPPTDIRAFKHWPLTLQPGPPQSEQQQCPCFVGYLDLWDGHKFKVFGFPCPLPDSGGPLSKWLPSNCWEWFGGSGNMGKPSQTGLGKVRRLG